MARWRFVTPEILNLTCQLFQVEMGELGSVAEELSKLGTGEVKEDLVQRAFTEMDVDMDGGVTQEEFVAACLQQRVAATSLALKVIDIFVAG